MGNKSFLGKGSIYLEEIGGATGLLPVGNAKDLSLAFNEDKKEQQDYQDAGGAVVNTVSRVSSVVGSVTLLELTAENLQKALRGLVNTVAAGTVVSEAHTAYSGAFVPFDKIADKSASITVTNVGATVTYVEGTDYSVKKNGVEVIVGGSIVDAAGIEISYTNLKSFNVEGLKDSGREYRMQFDGLNEADSSSPVPVTLFRVKINPAQALSLITADFGELAITFDVLKDTSIVGAGLSQFIKIGMTA